MAFKTELSSEAGRLNLIGMVMVFTIVVLVGGTFGGVQAVVRIWRPNYESGGPSPLVLVAVLTGLIVVCVVCVALVNPLRFMLRPPVSSRDVSEIEPQIEGQASAPIVPSLESGDRGSAVSASSNPPTERDSPVEHT